MAINLLWDLNKTDFSVFFNAGKLFLNDINNLYDQTNYEWPFRYLPLSALFFVPFYLLGFPLSLIVFNIINLILNFFLSIILLKIINLNQIKKPTNNNEIILLISIYLMGLPQAFNFVLGQINSYITLLILCSLLIFLKYDKLKWQFIAGVILGFSIILKPITILIVPFLIIFHYDYDNKKIRFTISKSLIRLIGSLLPLFFNLIIFILIPPLWEGFLKANLTGNDPSMVNHSFSITKLLINFIYLIGFTKDQILNIQLQVFLLLFVIVGGIGYCTYLFRRSTSNSLLYGYTFGILIILLTYFDSWDHHLLILIPLLIVIFFNLSENYESEKRVIKYSIFFFNFIDLIFMGIYFIIEPFFPFNFGSTVFLILLYYNMIKISILRSNNNSFIP